MLYSNEKAKVLPYSAVHSLLTSCYFQPSYCDWFIRRDYEVYAVSFIDYIKFIIDHLNTNDLTSHSFRISDSILYSYAVRVKHLVANLERVYSIYTMCKGQFTEKQYNIIKKYISNISNDKAKALLFLYKEYLFTLAGIQAVYYRELCHKNSKTLQGYRPFKIIPSIGLPLTLFCENIENLGVEFPVEIRLEDFNILDEFKSVTYNSNVYEKGTFLREATHKYTLEEEIRIINGSMTAVDEQILIELMDNLNQLIRLGLYTKTNNVIYTIK